MKRKKAEIGNQNSSQNRPYVAVRAIIRDADGRVLLLRRARTGYGCGEWCLPGGKIDYGQTAEKAVKDEVDQETGFHCLSVKFLFYLDTLPTAQMDTHYITLFFACDVEGLLKINEESDLVAWIDRNQLNQYVMAFQNDFALQKYWSV